MTAEYIEQRSGGYCIAGTRISLDSVVYSFQRGSSPETIQAEFPLLKLAQIYGAIAYYLDHQSAVDDYLKGKRRDFDDRTAVPLREANPELWAKLEGARQTHGKKT
jgi:uncharacterized protein (DUF433 family)